jgi:hypothetical protein
MVAFMANDSEFEHLQLLQMFLFIASNVKKSLPQRRPPGITWQTKYWSEFSISKLKAANFGKAW